uniref:CSON005344 protein n=1 Tax=Culicoides sonorensis TaxID=179676 RepID=A0A336LV17_CULSO
MEKIKSYFNTSLKIESVDLSEDSSSSEEEDMAPIGYIEPYTEGVNIEEYLERFEAYLMLQKITDDKEKLIALIGVSGGFLYNKLKSVCAPNGPQNKKYSDVKPLIVEALSSKKLVVVERAIFYSRHQHEGENASEFSLALRHLAQSCEFNEQLDHHLRDRFIMGLCNDNLRARIIEDNPETFERAIAIAQTNEISNRHNRDQVINNVGPRGAVRRPFARDNFPRNGVVRGNVQRNEAARGQSMRESARPANNRFFEQRRRPGNRGFQGVRNRRGRCYQCGSREHYRYDCPSLVGVRNLDDDHEDEQPGELNQLESYRPEELSISEERKESTSICMQAKRRISHRFTTGAPIYYYFKLKKKWLKGTIVKKISNLIYEVRLELGNKLKAHVSYLRIREHKYLSNEIREDEQSNEEKINEEEYRTKEQNNEVIIGDKQNKGHGMVLRPRKMNKC